MATLAELFRNDADKVNQEQRTEELQKLKNHLVISCQNSANNGNYFMYVNQEEIPLGFRNEIKEYFAADEIEVVYCDAIRKIRISWEKKN